MGKVIILVIALAYVLGSGYLLVDSRGKISDLEQRQVALQQKADQRTTALESNLKATADALASQVGMTQQELAKKTAALQASQHAAVSRLSEEQKQAIGEVNTAVSGVKSDVDVTKTDVATTKTDLEATKARLESTIGDLGVQSGLIAHSRDDLEILKHKGDRTYYDFTLLRGKPATRLSTVSLQLKRVDPKKNRFTLNVQADDKMVEKKDRNAEEPLQFYTGKDHQLLYEVVVFTVDKNQVTGYLSTPKQAPQDVSLLRGTQ
jgi:chromosome segregation ATPase